MSRMEYHIGKVQEIAISCAGFQDKYQFAITHHGLSADDADEESYIEDERFVYLERLNKMFLIVKDDENEYGHNYINHNGGGFYDFVLSYYNGGASFVEALESAFKDEYL